MAWGEKKVEDQRKLFCIAVLSGALTMAEACRQFSISRPTGYEWLERFKRDGELGLSNRSSARLSQDHQTPIEIKEKVIGVKLEYPTWGPKKVYAKLKERDPSIIWPSTTTIGKILTQNGLTKSRKIRRRLPEKKSDLKESQGPNDIWCMDFKGWYLTTDHQRFDPFTLSDHFSRFLIRCNKLKINNTDHAWGILDIAFREYGLPWILLSDNGPPFATCAPGRLSSLSIKLIKAGVIPEWIEPGKPQQNGRHERMHLTMEREGFFPGIMSLAEQSAKLEEFQQYYNFERPHEALGQKTPGSLYVPSNRVWNGKLQPLEYSSEYKIGRVKSCGKMSWKGKEIYISRVFSGENIGIKEQEEGLTAYFGPIYLGRIENGNELEVIRRETRKRHKRRVQ
jgi:transposase InsO family protein